MKAFLMYPDADFDVARPAPWNEAALTQDLGLDVLVQAMARGDQFLAAVAKQALLASTTEPDIIRYRQAILRDSLQCGDVVLEIYNLAVDAIERERKEYFGILSNYPGAILARSLTVMGMLKERLATLRRLVDLQGDRFESDGFRRLFAVLREELDPAFFEQVGEHLERLRFRHGVFISAELGHGLKGTHYVLRRLSEGRWSWLRRLFTQGDERAFTVYIHPRDETGARCLGELRDRGINLVANALAQSVDHVVSFFRMLRTELAFYLACVNLQGELKRRGAATCFPDPAPLGERRFSCRGLYDVGLALSQERKLVGNDVNADNRLLVIVTGANQGGKSTFLRSVGLAQLMMQCGMFVPAEAFCADVVDGVLTHFKRQEDAALKSGKFDEELNRMSAIVDHLTPHALVLCNESFAATNEREGSEVARQVVRALIDPHKKVFFVTHLYDFAHSFHERARPDTLFLRADRQPDGRRTFKLIEGGPLRTSFGQDLYDRIFGAPGAREPAVSGTG